MKTHYHHYEKDFYAWAMQNAKLLKAGKLDEADIEHIAEEIESMGKSERRALINRLAVLLAHLLKWQYQPERRCNSWKYTLEEQREEISDLLNDSPSLTHEIENKIERAYRKAILMAATEMGVNKRYFKAKLELPLKKILDKKFYPE